MPKRGAGVPTNLANYRKRDPSSKFEQYIPTTLGIWQRGSSDNLGFITHHSTQSQSCTSLDCKRRQENPEGTYEDRRRRANSATPPLRPGTSSMTSPCGDTANHHLPCALPGEQTPANASSDLAGKICNENKPTVLMCMCFPSQR